MNPPPLQQPKTVSLRSLYMSKKASVQKSRPKNGSSSRNAPGHDTAGEPYRIKKQPVVQATFRLEDNLFQKFSKYVDQNQQELADKADVELDKLEEGLYGSIEDIVEDMERKVAHTEAMAKRVFKPLAEEQLQITSTSVSEERTEVFVSLGERMAEFQEIINRHAKALDKLWAEWQLVQAEMVGLWAREFGPGVIPVTEADLSSTLRDAIDKGKESWQQTRVERKALEEEALALRKLIEDNASSTTKTAKEQEKIWSTAFQRKLHNILDNLKMIS